MDPFSHIQAFLAAVRYELRRNAGLRAVLYVVAGLSLLALLAPLAAMALPAHQSEGLAISAALAACAIVLAGLALGVVTPLRRWKNDDRVARHVGQQKPEVASDLLSSVEMLSTVAPITAARTDSALARVASSRRVSADLLHALLDQTARRVSAIRPRLIAGRSLRRAGIICAASVVLQLVLLLAASGVLAAGWQRLLDPHDPRPFGDARVSADPLVGDIRITLEYPAYTGRISDVLPSSSGDFRALPGTTVVLQTTALIPVAQARLIFEDDVKDGEDGRKTATPAPAAPGESNDSPSPSPTPTGPSASPDAADGQVDDSDDDERTELTMEIGPDGRSLSVRFPVVRAVKYRFLIETPTGEERVEELARDIAIDADQTPQVQLYTPGDEIDVASLKRIELAYIAEDDYGIDKVELVWEDRGKLQRKALPVPEESARRAQGKFLWDLAEVALEPGVQVSYHLEVTDNDTILGPNIGRSRSFRLRVFSPREKHEQLIARQRELFEKMLQSLGGRLVVAADDLQVHTILHRNTAAMVVELGTLVTALRGDELTDDSLRKALDAMRSRLDRLAKTEATLLARASAADDNRAKGFASRFAGQDAEYIAELEDDVILLANWIDRQQMENVLALSDEIKLHQDRLKQLFEEYQRTGSPELLAEIEREMKVLERRMAELAQKQSNMADDVLDRFVNAEAMQQEQSRDCMAEVRELLARGEAAAAQQRMAECSQDFDQATEAMEQALSALRSDSFSEEERKFAELMDKLSDLTQDQNELAAGAAEIWDRYAARADEMMREEAKETRKRVAKTLEKLKKQLDRVPEDGLTPFAREELEIIEARLDDVDKMLADGDIAEALAMAKQARDGIQVVASELEAAMEDQQGSPWNERTAKAQEEIGRARPLAKKLVEELEASTPSPRDIMSRDDRRQLEKLRRRQQRLADQTRRLAERAQQMAGDLPGSSGEAIARGVNGAGEHMKRAGQRMRASDPAGARQETRGAAEALERTLESGRDAARQRQASGRAGLRDEPIRIPGADEYRAPQEFREDILEAMKREKAPQGFGDMVKRYYEELIR